MQPSRSWIKDQILVLLNQSPKHGYDLLQRLNEIAPNLKLTTLYRWLHDMEEKDLVHSIILPGPYGPNRRVYRIGSAGEKRLNVLIGNSVQMILEFYNSFKNSLSDNGRKGIFREGNTATNSRVLFTAFPQVKKEDLGTLFFLSMRCINSPLEILGKSENVDGFGFNHKKIKGDIFELTERNGPFSEIWLKWKEELENLPRAIKGSKKLLSSKGILYVIVPSKPEKENHELSLREYIQGGQELEPKPDKIHKSEVGLIIKSHFSSCGSLDLFPGVDVYYCINDTQS
jgi:DNA-binding PadR family transcriptional regulator